MGVQYLLEGSISKTADQVRIGVELVDASRDAQVWAERFDRPLKDIFTVQDEIVGKVVTTLGLILKLDEMKVLHFGIYRPTDNPQAYDDLLRSGEHYWRFTKDDNAIARLWLDKAVTADPKFSSGYSLLGWTYWIGVWNQWSQNPPADLQRASQLASKTLVLDDSNSSALALLSYVDWMAGRFEQAVVDARRAVAIDPNYAVGYAALSDALANALEPEEALGAAQKAMRLDPASADYYAYCVGNAYAQMARYQEAIPVFKQNLSAYPNNLVAHLILIVADTEIGRGQYARTEAAEVMRISPHFTVNSLRGLKTVQTHKNWEVDWREAGLK